MIGRSQIFLSRNNVFRCTGISKCCQLSVITQLKPFIDSTGTKCQDNKPMKIKQQYCLDFKSPYDIQYIQAILHSPLSRTLWSQDWIRGRQWYDNPNDLYPQQRNAKQLPSWILFTFRWLQSSNHSTCISASTVFVKHTFKLFKFLKIRSSIAVYDDIITCEKGTRNIFSVSVVLFDSEENLETLQLHMNKQHSYTTFNLLCLKI